MVLCDDALNAIDHAARTLAAVLDIRTSAAWGMALQAHHCGYAVVWIGSFHAAHATAKRLTAAGPDPIMSAFGARPLHVQVLPADAATPP